MDTRGAKPVQRVTRTRTGCFTCRKRRIKCDERKPICFRCEKSYRKCSFPQSPVFTEKSQLESPGGSKGLMSESLVCHDTDSTATEINTKPGERVLEDEVSDQGQIVKFSPTPSQMHGDVSSESTIFEINADLPFLSPNSDGTTLSPFDQTYLFDTSGTGSPDRSCFRPASPLSTAKFISQFPGQPVPLSSPDYLQFHRERIIAAHYFWHYDYHEFCTKTILQLAENSVTLHHAVVAFSALIYSVKFNYAPARDYALAYYHWALKSFQVLLPGIVMGPSEQYVTALATALQLAAFDRFLADSIKCYRHLKGAAQIMQQCSNPITQSSTVLGRSLLQWYLHLEDNCTLALACKPQLSSEWRQADLRTRRKLAEQDYPRLSMEQRSARLLDDLWSELWALGPCLAVVFSKLTQLKKLQDLERQLLLDQLGSKLIDFQNEMDKFEESPLVREILELADVSSNLSSDSSHIGCCPPFPTESAGPIHKFRFPPAGHFKMTVLCFRLYMPTLLFAPLRDAGLPTTGFKLDTEVFDAAEMCRTYAGIEASFGDNMDLMLPSLYALVMAGFSCPRYLRRWLWCKLAHLEPLGRNYIEPIKEPLSVIWGRPELKEQGIGFGRERPEAVGKIVCYDDIDLAAQMAYMSLQEGSSQD